MWYRFAYLNQDTVRSVNYDRLDVSLVPHNRKYLLPYGLPVRFGFHSDVHQGAKGFV